MRDATRSIVFCILRACSPPPSYSPLVAVCVCIGIGFLHILSPSHIFRERRDADEIRCGECTSGFKLLRVYVYIIGEGGGLVF